MLSRRARSAWVTNKGINVRNIYTKQADVNRTVDGDTAEGHVRVTIDEAERKAAKKAAKRPVELDDEAEGHRRLLIDEADEARAALRTSRRVTKKPVALDDEAEGHALFKSR
jgi:hypothetical protein